MLTKGISFINYKTKVNSHKIRNKLRQILKEKNQVIKSLTLDYKNSFDKTLVKKYERFSNFRIIGLGGSILGSQAIYQFLKSKIKKNFFFIDNLNPKIRIDKKKKFVNIVVSKSGKTIETVANINVLLNKKDKNIFITENKINYLHQLAQTLKNEIIHHNNFIGGRYSVLSEVGMLPAELMNLKTSRFKQFNALIKNKKFINNLVTNVSSILDFQKKKKFNSVIINYDEKSEGLFKWYQQLVAESLGKDKKGILPIISNMPKDNHSVMQLYLDGFQNNFYTFFYVNEKKSEKIKNGLLFSQNFLKDKNFSNILFAQKKATENIFKKKKIPFRSFEIKQRNEKTLGELFTFFILETILIAKCLNLNPYNQPAVELVKNETEKILL